MKKIADLCGRQGKEVIFTIGAAHLDQLRVQLLKMGAREIQLSQIAPAVGNFQGDGVPGSDTKTQQ